MTVNSLPYKLRRLVLALLVVPVTLTVCLIIGSTVNFNNVATLASSAHYSKLWTGLVNTYSYGSDGLGGPQGNKRTLGVASKVYVLSLPNRMDRRVDMEYLRNALGLRWSYINAIPPQQTIINSITRSVRFHRKHSTVEFAWPNTSLLSANNHSEIGLFDPDFLLLDRPYSAERDENDSSGTLPLPLTCATLDDTLTPYSPSLPGYMILTAPRIACWYSHLSALERVANDITLSDDDSVIILEDDVDMERDTAQRLEYLWPFLPSDWDMVFLGHCWSNETAKPALNSFEIDDVPTFPATFLHPSNKPYCTHAYAVSRRGARRLLVLLRYTPFAFSRAIDQALSWLIQSSMIEAYSVVPSLVVQRKSGNSDIMPGKGSSWKGKLVNGVFSDSPGG